MEAKQRAPIGRPREFDIDEALESAMLVFWERGYDGVSLTDLTRAMGITKTSLYAAFGTKVDLFRKALDRFSARPGYYAVRALDEPTGRRVAEAYLTGAINDATEPGRPSGCLAVQGLVSAGYLDPPLREAVDSWRENDRNRLRDRLRRAVTDGDLPPAADPECLARVLITIVDGIAVQAVGGATRAELQEVAAAALRGWPT